MSRLLAAELLQANLTRSTRRFAAAGLGLALFIVVSYIGVNDLERTTAEDSRLAVAQTASAGLVALIFGAASMGGEVRHGTLAPALAVAPDRTRLVAVKALAAALLSAVAGLVIFALACLLVVGLVGTNDGELASAATFAGAGVATVVTCALYAALGVGVAALVGAQGAAIGIALAYIFVVEPIVTVLSEEFARWSLGGATGSLAGGEGPTLLEPWQGALVLAAYAAVAVAAGALAVRRRDVT